MNKLQSGILYLGITMAAGGLAFIMANDAEFIDFGMPESFWCMLAGLAVGLAVIVWSCFQEAHIKGD